MTRFAAAGLLRYPCGCDRNLSTQRAQQKKYFWPEYSAEYLAVAGFTFIPQTGSRAKIEVGSDTGVECSEAKEACVDIENCTVPFDCRCTILDSPGKISPVFQVDHREGFD